MKLPPFLRKALLPLVLLIAGGGYVALGFVAVPMGHTAVVTRFGAVVDPGRQPGWYFLPLWPVTKVMPVNTSNLFKMSVGYRIRDDVAGIPPTPEEMEFLTQDINIINVQLVFEYRITDAAAYLTRTDDPQFLIRNAAEARLTTMIADMSVDDLLTTGKQALTDELHQQIQADLDRYDVGIDLVLTSVRSIEPPAEVITYFQDVVAAQADMRRSMNDAHSEANAILPAARGEANRLVREAESAKANLISDAQGRGERFSSLRAEFRRAPESFTKRQYLSMVRTVIPRVNSLVLSDDGANGARITLVEEQQRGRSNE